MLQRRDKRVDGKSILNNGGWHNTPLTEQQRGCHIRVDLSVFEMKILTWSDRTEPVTWFILKDGALSVNCLTSFFFLRCINQQKTCLLKKSAITYEKSSLIKDATMFTFFKLSRVIRLLLSMLPRQNSLLPYLSPFRLKISEK